MMTIQDLEKRLKTINPASPTREDWETLSGFVNLRIVQEFIDKNYNSFKKDELDNNIRVHPFTYYSSPNLRKAFYTIPEIISEITDQDAANFLVSVFADYHWSTRNTKSAFYNALSTYRDKLKNPTDKDFQAAALEKFEEFMKNGAAQ